jgi:formylglycine-generating enzyme required for sulfatase activity
MVQPCHLPIRGLLLLLLVAGAGCSSGDDPSLESLLATGEWEAREGVAPPRFHHLATGLTFVLVPGGEFVMGDEEGDREEKPPHRVRVAPFLLAETECTQAAWDRIGGEDARRWSGEDLPIEGVTHAAVSDWVARAGLRLPSEAEWEYACRAGTTTAWSCGDDETLLVAHAWYVDSPGPLRTRAVGGLEPNPFGLFDLHGNVWEWVADPHHPNYEGAPDDGRAWTEGGTDEFVYRGGCWLRTAFGCRSSYRRRALPTHAYWHLGFRPAASITPR